MSPLLSGAYWIPNLVQWIVGGALSALAAAIVGFLVRRWFRQIFDQQQATAETAEAAGATTARAIEAWKQRTDDLLAAVLRQEIIAIQQERTASEQARLNVEVARIKAYLAEHEQELASATKRIIEGEQS